MVVTIRELVMGAWRCYCDSEISQAVAKLLISQLPRDFSSFGNFLFGDFIPILPNIPKFYVNSIFLGF
jgi:hypothetical protein